MCTCVGWDAREGGWKSEEEQAGGMKRAMEGEKRKWSGSMRRERKGRKLGVRKRKGGREREGGKEFKKNER